jgi:hypothetical protein
MCNEEWTIKPFKTKQKNYKLIYEKNLIHKFEPWLKQSTVKLGYNELGCNELPVKANKK